MHRHESLFSLTNAQCIDRYVGAVGLRMKTNYKAPLKISFAFLLLLLHAVITSGAVVATNIALGSSATHSLFIKSDGTVWGMGGPEYIGLGYQDVVTNIPQEIPITNVTAMALGYEYSLFVEADGTVWGAGLNESGCMGITNAIDQYMYMPPTQIPLSNVVAVAAGNIHSLFVESDGSLWGVGDDTYGQLGDGGGGESDFASQVEEIVPSGVTRVAAGYDFSLFVKSDGSLWGMGDRYYGKLGDGAPLNGTFSQTNLPEEIVSSGVVAVAAGYAHSLFLKSDGSLWGMGYNYFGQLGDGRFQSTNFPVEIVASNVTAIAAGAYHSLFLKSDGSLWAMGYDDYGQLGDGDIYTTGETNVPEEIVASNVVAIAAAENHSMFIKSDGTLWAMGDDGDGLGDGFTDASYAAQPERIVPPVPPVLAESVSGGTNLQFTSACPFGGNFYLLTSTNIALPLCQWSPVWTNIIQIRNYNVFSATLTNGVNAGGGQQFYILQSH